MRQVVYVQVQLDKLILKRGSDKKEFNYKRFLDSGDSQPTDTAIVSPLLTPLLRWLVILNKSLTQLSLLTQATVPILAMPLRYLVR